MFSFFKKIESGELGRVGRVDENGDVEYYRLLSRLGPQTLGGLANDSDVFLAESERDGLEYVLKGVDYGNTRLDNPNQVAKGVSVFLQATHPHIAKLFYWFEREDLQGGWMVMEYVRGESFGIYLRKDVFDIGVIIDVTVALVQALDSLHTKNAYYRDLRPEHLIINVKNGKLETKLVGFSLSCQGNDSGMVERVGTENRLPPEGGELIEGGAFGVWLLGVLVYEALDTENDWMEYGSYANFFVKNEGILEKRFSGDPFLVTLLTRMLAPNPNDRISLKDLNSLLVAWDYLQLPARLPPFINNEEKKYFLLGLLSALGGQRYLLSSLEALWSVCKKGRENERRRGARGEGDTVCALVIEKGGVTTLSNMLLRKNPPLEFAPYITGIKLLEVLLEEDPPTVAKEMESVEGFLEDCNEKAKISSSVVAPFMKKVRAI